MDEETPLQAAKRIGDALLEHGMVYEDGAIAIFVFRPDGHGQADVGWVSQTTETLTRKWIRMWVREAM